MYLLPLAVRVNETDTFADEDGANDEYFDFEDISGEHLLQPSCMIRPKLYSTPSISLPLKSKPKSVVCIVSTYC